LEKLPKKGFNIEHYREKFVWEVAGIPAAQGPRKGVAPRKTRAVRKGKTPLPLSRVNFKAFKKKLRITLKRTPVNY
jgi:hypothetical protein